MKDLIKVGKELNDLLFDDDEINVKGTKEEIEAQIVEAAELIDPTKDVISDKTIAVLERLGVWPDEDEPGDGDGKEGEEGPGDNLVDQINDAGTMKELKIIAKDLDEFKSLRGMLTKYKTKDDLREAMLDILEDEDPEEEEEKKPAAKKDPPAKKEPVKSAKKKEGSEEPMSVFADRVLLKGGTWKKMLAVCKEEAERRNFGGYRTIGALKVHIKYRVDRDSKWLGDLEVTEKGIE